MGVRVRQARSACRESGKSAARFKTQQRRAPSETSTDAVSAGKTASPALAEPSGAARPLIGGKKNWTPRSPNQTHCTQVPERQRRSIWQAAVSTISIRSFRHFVTDNLRLFSTFSQLLRWHRQDLEKIPPKGPRLLAMKRFVQERTGVPRIRHRADSCHCPGGTDEGDA